MNRKLKALGLALFAALALGAVGASAASGANHGFHVEVAPTHLTAEAKTAQEVIATPVDKLYFKCSSLSASGTVEATEVESVTVTPAYSECGIYEGESEEAIAYVEMESCHYIFGGETVETKLGSHATTQIECDEGGDHIEIKATALKLSCVSVPAQEVSGVHYENGEAGGVADILIEATIAGLEATTTSSLACPTESGETETHGNGTLIGDTTLKGHNEQEEPVGVSTELISDTHHVTAAEAWTPTVSSIGTQLFEATTGTNPKYKCKKVSMTVTEELPKTVEDIAVTPEYEECEAESAEETVVSAFVTPGGCEYIFKGVTTEGNPTTGEHANVEIKNHENTAEPCEIEIEVTAFKFSCHSIPNQTIKHAVRYEKGENGHIVLNSTAHGIKNTTTNSFACPTKTGGTEEHTNGSYTGKITVEGSNALGEHVPLALQEGVTVE